MKILFPIIIALGLAGCASGVSTAVVATSAVLTPAQQAQVQAICTAAAPLLAVATGSSVPAAISGTATYAASYCNGVSSTSVPATTTSGTPAWLSSVLSATETAAKVAGVVLPLLGIAL